MSYLFLFESETLANGGAGWSTRQLVLAVTLFLLMGAIIVGLGAVVGYKAFQPKNKK
jgi:hypothetical protein